MSPGELEAPRLSAGADAARQRPEQLTAPLTALPEPTGAPSGRTGCVLGFGDILAGDRAIGCCVVDALLHCCPGPLVTVAYCGGDFRGIEAWMYRAGIVHAVLGVSLGAPPGSVRSLGWEQLRMAGRDAHGLDLFQQAMGAALTRLRLIDAMPVRVVFHIVETLTETGLGMSRPAFRAARTVALRIRESLEADGLVPQQAGITDRLFTSIVLKKAF